MPKSDTWPGGVAIESLSNMDSSGSYDSVISMNSGYSEDSMEHLSAEERACLMYLEETIEALEVQEDSGLSNDEPDVVSQAEKMNRMSLNDTSSLTSDEFGRDQKSFLSGLSSPLAHLAADPPSTALTMESRSVHHTLNETAEPQPSPAPAANKRELKAIDLLTRPSPSVTESAAGFTIHSAPDGDGNPKSVTGAWLHPGQSAKDSDNNVALIPPPSDFMDLPHFPSQPVGVKGLSPSAGMSSSKPGATVDLEQLRQRALAKRNSVISVGEEPPSPPVVTPAFHMSPPDVPPSPSPPVVTPAFHMSPPDVPPSQSPPVVTPAFHMSPPDVPPSPSPSVVTPAFHMSPPDVPPSLPVVTPAFHTSLPPEAAEPRSPPAVAPKPKRLPANIILKSHKVAAAGSDGHSGHFVPTSSDRLMDPQRVHREALRKLGLLRSNEDDSGPSLSPKCSPKTRRSWAAPSPPISPAASQTPPLTPSYSRVNIPPPASVPLQSVPAAAVLPSDTFTAPSVQPPDILPAPAAFSDATASLPSDNELSTIRGVTEAAGNTPPVLVNQLTPSKITGIKSATLERSGMGLSSYMAGQNSSEAGQGASREQSSSQLRNSRPRPASLGSGKEFASTQGGGLQAGKEREPDSLRFLPVPTAPHASRDSEKLPRSQGISVVICPRDENEGSRREALKKLGLLRD